MNLPRCPRGCDPGRGYNTSVVFQVTKERSVIGEVLNEKAEYWCVLCGWRGQLAMKNPANPSFLYRSIRKYNLAKNQTQKDAILKAVGLHAELISHDRHPLPKVTDRERRLVLFFLRLFIASQDLEVKLKD
jgi:hypothetical protein